MITRTQQPRRRRLADVKRVAVPAAPESPLAETDAFFADGVVPSAMETCSACGQAVLKTLATCPGCGSPMLEAAELDAYFAAYPDDVVDVW